MSVMAILRTILPEPLEKMDGVKEFEKYWNKQKFKIKRGFLEETFDVFELKEENISQYSYCVTFHAKQRWCYNHNILPDGEGEDQHIVFFGKSYAEFSPSTLSSISFFFSGNKKELDRFMELIEEYVVILIDELKKRVLMIATEK